MESGGKRIVTCAYHAGVETNLTCSKCNRPICPKCMVQTPVGARCPDCARLSKLPTFHVPTSYYFRALGAALGMAIVVGIAWGFIQMFIPFFSFTLVLAPLAGWALGEVTGLAVNRKRSKGLATIAGITLIIAFAITRFFPSIGIPPLSSVLHDPRILYYILYELVSLGLGVFVTVNRMR